MTIMEDEESSKPEEIEESKVAKPIQAQGYSHLNQKKQITQTKKTMNGQLKSETMTIGQEEN